MTIATVPSADELHSNSVTRYDNTYEQPPLPPSAVGGVLQFYFPLQYGRYVSVLPMDLPPRWTRRRDYTLASTIDHNTMWADAVAWAISKQASLDWTVDDKGGSERKAQRAQYLLLNANKGQGWTSFLTQHLSDYFLTDNGAFVEVIWSTEAIRRAPNGQIIPAGRVIGIQHLDSVRCTRVNDMDLYPYREAMADYWRISPDEVHSENFPVIYADMAGRYHTLWRWQCLDFVDMPSPRIELRGTGMCAASRAYHAIFKDAQMERYVSEKIVGHSPKEIHLVSGIMQQQFEQATRASLDESRSENRQVYRGVVVIPGIKPDAAVSGYRIQIAGLPDNFDAVTERTNSYNKFAKALGLPAGDLERAPAGLNSGKTAETEQGASKDTVMAQWRKAWTHKVNAWVLPASTQFSWSGNDLADQKLRAEIAYSRAQTWELLVKNAIITAPQALQLAVDHEDIPQEMLPKDEVPQDALRDDQKPTEEPEQGRPEGNPAPAPVAPEQGAQPVTGQTAQPKTFQDLIGSKADEMIEYVDGNSAALLKITTKAADPIDAVWSDAVAWARAALAGDERDA